MPLQRGIRSRVLGPYPSPGPPDAGISLRLRAMSIAPRPTKWVCPVGVSGSFVSKVNATTPVVEGSQKGVISFENRPGLRTGRSGCPPAGYCLTSRNLVLETDPPGRGLQIGIASSPASKGGTLPFHG